MSDGSLYAGRTVLRRPTDSVICTLLYGFLTSCASCCAALPLSVFLFIRVSLTQCLSSMQRLDSNGSWSFFDPLHVPGLTDLYGDAFDAAYMHYESQGLATAVFPARGVWDIISDCVRESGCPFIMFGDNVNGMHVSIRNDLMLTVITTPGKNNQMHLGIIKSSNLGADAVQQSSPTETAVSPSASLCLPRFVRESGLIEYVELHRATKLLVRSLDRLVDLASYSTSDTAVSAYRTRSISIGAQGLADVFAHRELPFTSDDARLLNKYIYETIYHASLESSAELAELLGPYDSWPNSPAQQGVLQFDMWHADVSDRYDFDSLRDRIRRFGLRNSVLTAQMPTTATSTLFSTSESFEPYVRYDLPSS